VSDVSPDLTPPSGNGSTAPAPAPSTAPAIVVTSKPTPKKSTKRRRKQHRRPHVRELPGEVLFKASRSMEGWRIVWVAVIPFLVFSGLAIACWLDSSMNQYKGLATGFAAAALLIPIFELLGVRRRLVVGKGWMARGAGRRWKLINLSEVVQIRQKYQPKMGFGDYRTILLFEDSFPLAFEVSGMELAEGAAMTLVGQLSPKVHLDDAARYLLPAAWPELRDSPALASLGAPADGGKEDGGKDDGDGGGGGNLKMPKAPKAPKAPSLKSPKAPSIKAPKAPSLKAPKAPSLPKLPRF
jgi:hypothetical protein